MKKNFLVRNPIKFCLIGKIKGLSGESRRTRISFLKNKKKESALNYQKFLLKKDTRNHLLAYGFLRGLNYKDIEKNCAFNNKPNIKAIFEIIKSTIPSSTLEFFKINEEALSKWIGV